MNTRALTKDESFALSKMMEAKIDPVLLYTTETMRKKSIADATAPFRKLLSEARIHDYNTQTLGQEGKVILPIRFFDESCEKEIPTSFYRPQTKKGDPRFWPNGFRQYFAGGEIVAFFTIESRLYGVNLTRFATFNVDSSYSGFLLFIDKVGNDSSNVAMELLSHLKEVSARGALEAVCAGDTAVGRTLEEALGIKINSSKSPDYKGIEIKAFRASRGKKAINNRKQLFSRVPDWKLSSVHSINKFLERFGYSDSTGKYEKMLRCTVSSNSANSQNLILNLDSDKEELEERLIKAGRGDEILLVWRLSLLHEALQNKHKETFWVSTREVAIRGKVFFEFDSVKYTSSPSNRSFDRLINSGEITLDHMISQKYGSKAREKGPSFKVRTNSLNELFLGEPKIFSLR